jgi:regulatory protein
MQAIGFLSRREHSRQELRRKLLESLRKRAREEAAMAAAAEKAAQELAQALRDSPSNGIDDAFAPARASAQHAHLPRVAPAHGGRGPGLSVIAAGAAAHGRSERAALGTLSLASGAPLPASLRARLASLAPEGLAEGDAVPGAAQPPVAAGRPPVPPAGASVPGGGGAPILTRTALAPDAQEDFVDPDGDTDGVDLPHDDPSSSMAPSLSASEHELNDPEAAVDDLLDWLVAHKYLSEPRFVESRVNARSRKQGTLLIKLELSRHGLTLEPEQAAALRETEFARAQALWQRKFGELAADPRTRAKQARFLAARGFAADVVRRVVGGEEED